MKTIQDFNYKQLEHKNKLKQKLNNKNYAFKHRKRISYIKW